MALTTRSVKAGRCMAAMVKVLGWVELAKDEMSLGAVLRREEVKFICD